MPENDLRIPEHLPTARVDDMRTVLLALAAAGLALALAAPTGAAFSASTPSSASISADTLQPATGLSATGGCGQFSTIAFRSAASNSTGT